MQALEMTGKVAIVTGGSRGIGRATAIMLAEAGAKVVITYERNREAADATVAANKNITAQQVDLRNEASIMACVKHARDTFGRIDVLVANAGIWEPGDVDTMSVEDFERTMSINMTGTFLMTKHVTPIMKQQGSGAITIVSSTAGQRGEAGHSHYAASKGAQISFTKSLAVELAPTIRVNCVAPGWVRTDMTEATLADPNSGKRVLRTIPLQRVAEPEEIANAILFLSSPLASFITGEILNVNGGAVLCG